MARPKKAVVDYFPLDCDWSDSLKCIENSFGNNGFALWIKLLQKLGVSENHYIDCNNLKKWKLLYAEMRVNEDLCIQILDELAELGSIDKELWQQKIIYSENFVKRLTDVYTRRKMKLPTKTELLYTITQSNKVSVNKNPENDDNNPQSKLNEIKEDEINNYPPTPQQNFSNNPDEFITTPVEEIKKNYNEICKKLTPVSTLSFSRRKNVVDRWKENPSMDFWKQVFRLANEIYWEDINRRPNFDWIFKNDTNYLTVIEGVNNNGASDKDNTGSGLTDDIYDLSRYKIN